MLICADADVDGDAAGGLLDVSLEASWRSIWSRFGDLLEVGLALLEVGLEASWESLGRSLGGLLEVSWRSIGSRLEVFLFVHSEIGR